jgi:hypothetical protein
MALSKEFYLEEIKSKYPNSYNKSLEDLPVKDLEDMLDFLDEALGKADGGSIGIEVLFGPKVPAAPSQLVEESEIVLGIEVMMLQDRTELLAEVPVELIQVVVLIEVL